MQTAYGLMANFCLLFFYAAPLTTLAEVIKNKDASSIDPLRDSPAPHSQRLWSSRAMMPLTSASSVKIVEGLEGRAGGVMWSG